MMQSLQKMVEMQSFTSLLLLPIGSLGLTWASVVAVVVCSQIELQKYKIFLGVTPKPPIFVINLRWSHSSNKIAATCNVATCVDI
jgi:hypothetical protein